MCNICFGTGWVTLTRKEHKISYDFWFSCTCEDGNKNYDPGKPFQSSSGKLKYPQTKVLDFVSGLRNGYEPGTDFQHLIDYTPEKFKEKYQPIVKPRPVQQAFTVTKEKQRDFSDSATLREQRDEDVIF